jgi:hypothetical protein
VSGYTLKVRGAPTGRREYACPAHGPFELEVDLATSGDPRPCPECGAASDRTLTQNVLTRMALTIESGRGRSDPPPSKLAMDTRPLFERKETAREYRRRRRKLWRDHDRAAAKKAGAL